MFSKSYPAYYTTYYSVPSRSGSFSSSSDSPTINPSLNLLMSKRILIIDDEPYIREIIQVSLEMFTGWQVLTAGSGDEGVSIC
jgi:hypothetical protein